MRAHLDRDFPLLAIFKSQGLEHTIQGSDCSSRCPRAAEYQGYP
jgi:hypothetical protein